MKDSCSRGLQHIVRNSQNQITVIFSWWNIQRNLGQIHTEAYYLADYFKSIKPEDIEINVLLEDTSINSIQNIDHSLRSVPEWTDTLYIVSSDYHILRLVATYKQRMKKLWITNISIVWVSANKELENNTIDQNLIIMLQEWKSRPLLKKAKEQVIEKFGHGLALLGEEDLLSRIPSDTPLWKVPLVIMKLLWSKD